jgi:peptidoglycan/xylan/chitin deacetylase (PgdA/CDA1 family)
MSLQRNLKLAGLQNSKAAGVFSLFQKSDWRRRRLLILCYHGISVDREHEWRPALFMPPAVFEQRMASLKRSGISVLSLDEGVRALVDGTLDEAAAVITFDDGFQDYFQHAAPILDKYSLPATVYLTTWYVDRPYPVFGISCSYVLWMSVGSGTRLGKEFGFLESPPLETVAQAGQAADAIVDFVDRQGFSGDEKDELMARLCRALGVDYEGLLRNRVLGLMNTREVQLLASSGTDFQLHTHRHRTPPSEELFRREIADNRACLERITNRRSNHFCYPSGVCDPAFLPWLRAEGIRSATTCESGLAERMSDPLTLPRLLDGAHVNQLEFEAWLSGVGPWVRRWL